MGKGAIAPKFSWHARYPAWCHPIVFRRIEECLQREPRSARMIVVDPRRTQSAAMADLHLQIQPGTDITLFHAIARKLIEAGFIDGDFVRDHSEGFDDLRGRVFGLTRTEAAAICRIETAAIETAAEWIGESKGLVSLWAMGLNQSLTGQPNAMGGREVGGMASLMSAHRDMKNPAHREEIARLWGVPSVPESPGLTAGEMMDALCDGRLKALWVICTNPLVSWPDLAKAERALAKAFLDRTAPVYKKCVVRNDRLVGALLVGDSSEFVLLRDLIRSGEELGARRETLLRGNSQASPHRGGKIVCSCASVDEATIGHACDVGATTVQKLMDATSAGTGCGSCRPEIASMLKARGGEPTLANQLAEASS